MTAQLAKKLPHLLRTPKFRAVLTTTATGP
jgi:hypothetical protein